MPPDLTPYARLGVQTVPRCLGQLDRRPESPTFGCGDVHFWRYRMRDFPNARLQEMAWLLALVYARPLPGAERYYRNPHLRTWILGALVHWTRRQHTDGTVAEAYPYERSFCATAFSTWAMSEVWRLLTLDEFIDAITTPLRHAIVRGAEWLAERDKPALSNQMAAAVAALVGAHHLEPDLRFDLAAEAKAQRLLQEQRSDGAFPEYGGYDYGYQSITLSVLMHVMRRWPHETLATAVAQGGTFLERAIDERGLYDYTGASRQTQYLYPSGLVQLGLPCVDRHLRGIAGDEVITPLWMDDRYCIGLAIDYLLAYLSTEEEPA